MKTPAASTPRQPKAGFRFARCAVAAIGFAFGSAAVNAAQDANAMLDAAAKAMGATNINAVQVTATGFNHSFGQAFKPGGPWPAFKVTSFSQTINLADPSMRIELERTNPDGPLQGGGGLPLAAPQKQIQAVNGTFAWNVGVGPAGVATPALNTANERLLVIWMSPLGVIRAGQQNKTTVSGRTFSFTTNGSVVKATLNPDNTIQKVETTVDTPVTGDTAIVWEYSGYKDFGVVKYPSRLVQLQGGHPILDLNVSDVRPSGGNAPTHTPQNVAQSAAGTAPAAPATPPVTMTKVADGVHHLTGGSHHSLVVEFKDHVVLFEVPQSDVRAMAVIDATRKAFPGKPIRYVVNSHHHFDHMGGIRAAISEGLTIIAQAQSKPYFEKVAAMPHTLVPDRLAKAPKKPVIETVDTKRVLTDGTQTLELHWLPTNHTDTMLIGYLPAAKLLFEVDVYTPGATAPTASLGSPVTTAFLEQIEKMKLDVTQIIPGHGPRLVTLSELRTASGKAGAK